MKTRIKVVKGDDYSKYYPQYKRLFWWRAILNSELVAPEYTFHIERAKATIDEFLKPKEPKNNTTYIVYPEEGLVGG